MDAMLIDAQIIRLYQAFFARQPDQAGFNYWEKSLLTQSASLQDIAQAFSQSSEFTQTYGNLDDGQFINLVYQQVLDREPDTEGFAYWQAALNDGFRRGDLMVSFSESQEFIQKSSTTTAISQLQLEKTVNTDAIFQQKENIYLIVENGIEESSDIIALDINGDGLVDLLNARTTPILQDAELPLDLFINQGNSQFQTANLSDYVATSEPTLQNTAQILRADLNGDGIDDLVMAGRGVNTEAHHGERNEILLSDGVNNWRNAEENLPNDISVTHSLAAGDIDKDGDLDLLVGNVSFYALPYLLVNDGNGKFTRDDDLLPNNIAAKDQVSVHLADLNNDGAADMVIGADNTAAGYVVFSDGNGSFKDQITIEIPVPDLDSGGPTLDIESYDVNGDGWLDLLVSHTRNAEVSAYDGNIIQVLISQQGQYFIDETDIRIPEQSSSLLQISDLFVEDLNNDGYKDILAEQTGDYFLNNGQGIFSTHGVIANYNEGDGPFVLADIDNDQQLELVVADIVTADVYQ